MFKSETLREARLAKGMTQEDLAAALGVTVRAVAHWEGGSRTPRPHALLAICRVTERPIHDFINGVDPVAA